MLVVDRAFTGSVAEDAGRICQQVLPRLMSSLLDAERFGEPGQEARDWLVLGAIERRRLSAENFLEAVGGRDSDGREVDFGDLLDRLSKRDFARGSRPSEQRFLTFVTTESDDAPALGVVELGVDCDKRVRFVRLAFHGDGGGRDSFTAALEKTFRLDDERGDSPRIVRIFDIPEVYLSFVHIEYLDKKGLEGDDYRVYKIDRCCDGSREPQEVDLEAARKTVSRILQLRRDSGEPEGRSGTADVE